MGERPVLTVNCAQCRRRAPMRERNEHGEILPPKGWLEVMIDPRGFPDPELVRSLIVRVCDRCNTPDRAAPMRWIMEPDHVARRDLENT